MAYFNRDIRYFSFVYLRTMLFVLKLHLFQFRQMIYCESNDLNFDHKQNFIFTLPNVWFVSVILLLIFVLVMRMTKYPASPPCYVIIFLIVLWAIIIKILVRNHFISIFFCRFTKFTKSKIIYFIEIPTTFYLDGT